MTLPHPPTGTPPGRLPTTPPGGGVVLPPPAGPAGLVSLVTPTGLSPAEQPQPSPLTPAEAPLASAPGVTEYTPTPGAGRVVMDELLHKVVTAGGSDLHLAAESPPLMRLHGTIQPVDGYDTLTPAEVRDAVYSILTDKQRAEFEDRWELDCSYTLTGHARFRVSVLRQRGMVEAVLRVVPNRIRTLEELGMPPVVAQLAGLPRGFVLITGPTGSGKSTTLAALIDRANTTRAGHILTIEDPIEYVHRSRRCVIRQREVGHDTRDMLTALRHGLRQDPDIIVVGELRDLETMQAALRAAETGHLVFATLHSQSAQETISRFVDVFPPAQQQQVRTQLAACLEAVVSQTLCQRADGTGQVAAVEVMVCTPAIRAQIREGKLEQVQASIQTGSQHGMQTLNQDLARLAKQGVITYQEGLAKCTDEEDYINLTGGEQAVVAAVRMAAARAGGLASL